MFTLSLSLSLFFSLSIGAIIGAPGLFPATSETLIYTSDILLGDFTGPAPPTGTGCTHADDMTVFCQEEEFYECHTGDIRLAGTGSTTTEGRLEICVNDKWGTVCDDSWHVTASAVACKVLGMFGGEVVGASQFGDVEDLSILLDDVKCQGSESNMLSCPQPPLGVDHNCAHSEDVAIRCIGNTRLFLSIAHSEKATLWFHSVRKKLSPTYSKIIY